MPPGADSLTQLGLAGLLIVVLAWLANTWITGYNKRPQVMTVEQLIKIIQENTEINSKLVSAVEQQTRVIQDLASAVNKLLGKLEG